MTNKPENPELLYVGKECLSLRDYFAGQCLTFMGNYLQGQEEEMAEISYKIADCMLKERAKQDKE